MAIEEERSKNEASVKEAVEKTTEEHQSQLSLALQEAERVYKEKLEATLKVRGEGDRTLF